MPDGVVAGDQGRGAAMINRMRSAAVTIAAGPITALLILAVTGCGTATTANSSAPTDSSAGLPSSVVSSAVAQTSAGNTSATETSVPAPPAAEASTAAALPECSAATLPTRTPGTLTLATAEPLRSPWFTGTDPAGSDGYEAQVARDIAQTLGFAPEQQVWRTVDQQGALLGTDAGFDVFLGQVSAAAGTGADFSSGYYSITDAVLMPATAAAALTGAPDLTGLRTGVLAASTGSVTMQERGVTPARVFDSPTAAAAALAAGTIDAAVVPTPDAIDIAAAQPALVLVGQLPPPAQSQPDQFHVVLAKDSALTACVNAAIDRLRVEQTLDQLTQQWITGPLAPQLP